MKKNKITFAAATLILIFVAVMACMGKWQADNYESSILSIYAQQQDAYVQLVLDQINMLENRSDDEIVHKILGSLDTSDRKYWTLSKEQALLFVKDVMETNRYKGLTSESFFTSDSASYFLSNLGLNHVAHEVIEMEGDKYVASGVVFEYNGARYKICLLTNDTVILDNNVFLSAKISIYIWGLSLLGVLLLVGLIYTGLMVRKDQSAGKQKERITSPNRIIAKQEAVIAGMDAYQPLECVSSVYDAALCGQTGQAGSEKVVFASLAFTAREDRDTFLEKAQLLLDEKNLRFAWGKRNLGPYDGAVFRRRSASGFESDPWLRYSLRSVWQKVMKAKICLCRSFSMNL
ncbi:MAG: hypothetical protein ACLTHS_08700 [Eubacterium sp.]